MMGATEVGYDLSVGLCLEHLEERIGKANSVNQRFLVLAYLQSEPTKASEQEGNYVV